MSKGRGVAKGASDHDAFLSVRRHGGGLGSIRHAISSAPEAYAARINVRRRTNSYEAIELAGDIAAPGVLTDGAPKKRCPAWAVKVVAEGG
ncbi:MAG TPA: hypothetical protein VN821_01160, partial [Candidatus Udaeobacter sp.]|nr:hypothetical protein [Candidatus Udaeobacter sp.]